MDLAGPTVPFDVGTLTRYNTKVHYNTQILRLFKTFIKYSNSTIQGQS